MASDGVPRIRVNHEGPLLAVAVEDHDAATLVQVRGEIDLSNARELEATFGSIVAGLRSAPRVVVIDLSGVTFFSAAGLSALVRIRQGSPGHLTLRIVAATRTLRRLLEITDVGEQFVVHACLEEALDAAARGGEQEGAR